MQLFTAHLTLALSAAGNHSRIATAANHGAKRTANGTAKRTAWYPAFSKRATWSSIG